MGNEVGARGTEGCVRGKKNGKAKKETMSEIHLYLHCFSAVVKICSQVKPQLFFESS